MKRTINAHRHRSHRLATQRRHRAHRLKRNFSGPRGRQFCSVYGREIWVSHDGEWCDVSPEEAVAALRRSAADVGDRLATDYTLHHMAEVSGRMEPIRTTWPAGSVILTIVKSPELMVGMLGDHCATFRPGQWTNEAAPSRAGGGQADA